MHTTYTSTHCHLFFFFFVFFFILFFTPTMLRLDEGDLLPPSLLHIVFVTSQAKPVWHARLTAAMASLTAAMAPSKVCLHLVALL